MPICKTCGEKFHYCTSCDYDELSEMGYCCQKCFYKDPKFIELRKDFEYVLDNTSEKVRDIVIELLFLDEEELEPLLEHFGGKEKLECWGLW